MGRGGGGEAGREGGEFALVLLLGLRVAVAGARLVYLGDTDETADGYGGWGEVYRDRET